MDSYFYQYVAQNVFFFIEINVLCAILTREDPKNAKNS